jgi:predicted DNA-binding transcriptional regulator AlpA
MVSEPSSKSRTHGETLDVDERVIYNQRYLGKGPRGARIGRELRFRRSEINRWLAEREDHG